MKKNKYWKIVLILCIVSFISVFKIGFVSGKKLINTYDVNQDGKIDICDAITIIKFLRCEETGE